MVSFGKIATLHLAIFTLLLTVSTSMAMREEEIMMLAYQSDILEFRKGGSSDKLLTDASDDLASKVVFYLFTRDNPLDPEVLILGDTQLLHHSAFDCSKPTKVLIHGWYDSVNRIMIPPIKNSFLETMDVNILAVDWSKIGVNINYIVVAKKTGVVGEYVASMLDFLMEQGCNASSFHMIGHSLGAHVAGSAGRAVKTGRIARITGLDAALPGFGLIRVAERLSDADAVFVDCIHTCGGLLGINEAFCHADFYPNGGANPQPGCPLLDFGRCSHLRAVKYFSESILKHHYFPALYCGQTPKDMSYCSKSSILMGYPIAFSTRGIYGAYTESSYPYAPDIF